MLQRESWNSHFLSSTLSLSWRTLYSFTHNPHFQSPHSMAHPPRRTHSILLILSFQICFSTIFAVFGSVFFQEEFSEELLLKPLPDRKVLAHFHFETTAPPLSTSHGRHHHLFPKAIAQLVCYYSISFTSVFFFFFYNEKLRNFVGSCSFGHLGLLLFALFVNSKLGFLVFWVFDFGPKKQKYWYLWVAVLNWKRKKKGYQTHNNLPLSKLNWISNTNFGYRD